MLSFISSPLLRHLLPEQHPSIQYPELPSSLPPHEAQLIARPVSQTSPPVPLCALQICRQHPLVPPGSHPLPDHLLSSTSHWPHGRELQHHTDVSCQAALLASCRPSSSQKCGATQVPPAAAGAVGGKAGSATSAFFLFIIIVAFSSDRWGVVTQA